MDNVAYRHLEAATDETARAVNPERALISLAISAKRIARALEVIAVNTTPPQKSDEPNSGRNFVGMPG